MPDESAVEHFILATAGHVDHGKTALVQALTGTDTDRLPEEKARGITIELGFAHLELPATLSPLTSQLSTLSIGVIDVPGHEDFVRNMVAGVGAIDLALFVIAADDGWMPQTEEHLQILEYLGVTRAVVALTKTDLAPPPEDSIRARLAGSVFANARIVPVSSRTGEGVEELGARLAQECSSLPSPRNIGKPRLAVDRSFTLRGIGPVVTGTLSGGILRRGDEVIVQPSGVTARIRALQTHNREVEQSLPGMRTALNIPGAEIARGAVITHANLGSPNNALDVLVRRSSRLPATTRKLRHGSAVRVHHGSASSSARIFFAGVEGLGPAESAIAQLRFDQPVFAFAGDRFVLRDSSGQQTLAGALVLDPDAKAKDFGSPAQQRLLRARAAAPDSAQTFARTQLERDHFARRGAFLLQSRFSADEVGGDGELLIEAEWWRTTLERAAKLIDAEHRVHPNLRGLEVWRLREAMSLPLPELFEKLIADLCASDFTRTGDVVHRRAHRASLPPSLRAAAERIGAALAAKPFDPPSRRELAPDRSALQALKFLCETKAAIEISPDLVVRREALEEMRAKIVAHLESSGGATVSDLRQALGSSRRVVVPLLEYFDRLGVTRRLGDKRVPGHLR